MFSYLFCIHNPVEAHSTVAGEKKKWMTLYSVFLLHSVK